MPATKRRARATSTCRSVPRESARNSALTRIVKTFFDGSAAQAAAALVDSGSLSDEELTRLSALIDRARKEGR